MKLRHICAQLKDFVAWVDDNKKNKLEDSQRDTGKGHLNSYFHSVQLRQS